MIEKYTLNEKYIQMFDKNKDVLTEGSAGFINSVRESAYKEFAKTGLPVGKNENFKYTDLVPALNLKYFDSFTSIDCSFDIEEVFHCDIPDIDANLVILLNGFFYEKFSRLDEIPKGVLVTGLRHASHAYPELVKEHYGTIAPMQNNGLIALNSMFAQDGIFIHVPKGIEVHKPIQIINLILSQLPLMVQHRNLFIAEENSSVEVIVCEHTLNERDFLANSTTEVAVAANARFNYSRIQNQNNQTSMITNICFDQKENSQVNVNTITLHGGLTRNNIYCKLDGEGSGNTISGFFYCDEQQHVDYYTQVDHIKPNCQSNQLIKGVLEGQSTGAFNGKIHVHPDAQKTMAYQRNNNILLSDAARMNSKPTLEIYADDVKCSHGATIGQLDEDALFYLRSRGIGSDEARLLLMSAFAHEVINSIKIEPLRDRIEDLIDKRLRGELSRCHNCALHCC